MLLSGRLHLPTLLLPLLVLSVTFSGKPVYPDVWLHQIISSAFIICAIIVFYRSCRKNIILAFGVPISLVLLRIIRFQYGEESGVFEAIYFVPYSILLLGVGTKMVRDHPLLMLRQIIWICAISIVLMLMQIMGVQWAQSLTNFYWYNGGSTESYLFVWWSDLPPASGIQMRPVGFASANNVLSQYLVLFYAFGILWFADKTQRFKPPLKWLFIISFACALSGAKVVLSGVVLINIAALLIAKKESKLYLFRVFLTTLFAYFCYFLLFPGLFVYNFNLDLFAFNSMLRLSQLIHLVDIPYAGDILNFLSQFQTGEYIGQRSVMLTLKTFEDRALIITGIGTVAVFYPVIISICLLVAPFWITRLRKSARGHYVDMQKVPLIMLVATVAGSMGGPFLFTSYFWFFFSFALYPLSVLLLSQHSPLNAEIQGRRLSSIRMLDS